MPQFLKDNHEYIIKAAAFVVALVFFLYGKKGLVYIYREKKQPIIDQFNQEIDEFTKQCKQYQESSIIHQSGEMVESAEKSRSKCGRLKKALGFTRQQIEDLFDPKSQDIRDFEKKYRKWTDSIFTEDGYITNKGKAKSTQEIDMMLKSYQDFTGYLSSLKTKASRRKLKLRERK